MILLTDKKGDIVMRRLQKIISIALVVIILQSMTISASAKTYPSLFNFKETQTYLDNQFSDVPSDAWYYSNVKKAFELGLMKGSSETFFNANGNVTIAEAITMASRLHAIYNTGEETFEQTVPWYKTYVDYASENNIINDDFTNYTKAATREEFAYILSNSLPDSALKLINTIEAGSIPDVPTSQKYAADIYKLYRAGILTGNDKMGTFTPKASIQRSAAAAIITRMADSSLRQNNKLVVKAYFPLEVTGVNYKYDIIGTLMLNVAVKNTGTTAIDAFEYYSLVYDAYGEPIYYYGAGTNEFTGTWSVPTNQALRPGKTISPEIYWTYYGFEGVKRVEITLTKAHTVDGKTYELDEDHYTWTAWVW